MLFHERPVQVDLLQRSGKERNIDGAENQTGCKQKKPDGVVGSMRDGLEDDVGRDVERDRKSQVDNFHEWVLQDGREKTQP